MPTIGAVTTCSFACRAAAAAGRRARQERRPRRGHGGGGRLHHRRLHVRHAPAGRHAADTYRFLAFLDLDFGDARFLE